MFWSGLQRKDFFHVSHPGICRADWSQCRHAALLRKGGLLAPARDANGYRIYSERDAAWLAFILRLKETNMPLAQIKAFARLRAEGEATLAARYALLLAHQRALAAQLARLADHRAHLAEKLRHYEALLRSS